MVLDEIKGLSMPWRIRHGGGKLTNGISFFQDGKGWPEVDVKNPAHLQHLQFIGGLQHGVAHGLFVEQAAEHLVPYPGVIFQAQRNHRVLPGFFHLKVFQHNPQDVHLVGVTDKPAVEQGVCIQIFWKAEPVVEIDGAADEPTLAGVQTMEDAVPVELPKGKFGMIGRVGVAECPVSLILGKAADVMKKGGCRGHAAIVFRKAEIRSDAVHGRADMAGVFRFQVQAALVCGVRFPKGCDVPLKPVPERLELFLVHPRLATRYAQPRRLSDLSIPSHPG